MGVSQESISKFLIGNRFHVKLRILSPENCKQSLQVKSWKAEVTGLTFYKQEVLQTGFLQTVLTWMSFAGGENSHLWIAFPPLWVLLCFFSAVTSAFQLFTCKRCLQFSGLRMRNFTWNRGCVILREIVKSLLTPIVESTYLNRDMCKFESSQKDESRWQSTDSLKAYRNISAFKCSFLWWQICHRR